MDANIIHILDLAGVVLFAMTGALAAGRKKMDIFGVVVVAIATAIGGGTIRDVILGIRPVLWIADPVYVYVATAAALITFLAAHRLVGRRGRILLLLDAVALAIFTVIGCQKAIAAHVPLILAPIMGVITGVAGGIIRDMLCGEIPLVLRKEVYATASLLGGVLLVAMYYFGAPRNVAEISAILLICAIRLAAIYWKVSLPTFPDQEDEGKGLA